MDEERPRAHHDLGGVSRFLCEPIDTKPHALSDFDREIDALLSVLRQQGLIGVDELRRGIEAIPEEDYFRLGYYERWLRSITATLLRKGIVTESELRAELERR
jgi:hypothetical protein